MIWDLGNKVQITAAPVIPTIVFHIFKVTLYLPFSI